MWENLNKILGREEIAKEIQTILQSFDVNCRNVSFKKGIYIYGSPGCGKTEFVMNILKDMDYDVIKYDAGDIRNKSIIDTITKHNMSDKNIMSMFEKKVKKIEKDVLDKIYK